MEKKFKPVPDVECLKYHGAPEKPDIKIFVSHRIDLDSETIDNPLYIPVRCGAVYDERESVTMLGDDTGDNISEKRVMYGELTVQYWAWKNVKADYYGLCHYRRMLSFSDKKMKVDFRNQVVKEYLNRETVNELGLLSCDDMRKHISNNDIVTSEYSDISKIGTPKGYKRTVIEHWRGWEGVLIEDDTIEKLRTIVKKKYPKYADAMDSYLKGSLYRGYNCFIMSRCLFCDLCEFQFGVLFELEKHLAAEHYSEVMLRTLGFMGEILSGTFIYYLDKCGNIRIDCRQLVFFENVDHQNELFPLEDEKSVPIVVMSSNAYITILSVFLHSLLQTMNSSVIYDVIVLHRGIEKKEMERIRNEFCDCKNISVRFYNPCMSFNDIDFYVASQNYAKEAYYRVLSPWILNNYDKVLIMDLDIILQSDISELYFEDLEDKIAIGVRDILWQGMITEDFEGMLAYLDTYQIKDPYGYINTGVVVLDLEKMRQIFSLEEVLQLAKTKKYRYQEQCLMNILLEGKIKYVDPEWNYLVPVNPDVKRLVERAPYQYYIKYQSCKTAKVLHYAARPKPWEWPEVLSGEKFWIAARRSTYYEALINRMIDMKQAPLFPAVYDLQRRAGVFDTRSGARIIADKLMPKGTRRREFAKKILPKDSRRWGACKQIYYIFCPKYRPKNG